MTGDTATAEPADLITDDGQVQWAGLLMGPGTDYPVAAEGLTGWEELPALDTSDADRPSGHGGWPGSQWAQVRVVTATVWFAPAPEASTEDVLATLRTLRAATAVKDEEEWLAVRLHGETLAVRARVTQRVVPTDQQFAARHLAKMTLQWKASDPRRYETVQRGGTLVLPQPEPGLSWPLTWPLAWGAPASTGDLAVENTGSAPAQPVITFTGPCTQPRLANRTSGDWLEYAITLAEDDELVVDTAEGTVTFNGTASRRHTATPGSAPEEAFALPPGTSQLSFRAGAGEARLAIATVSWRSAEW